MDVFGDAWARAWGEALNHSREFKAAAAWWEGSFLLVGEADAVHPVQRVYLEISEGRCLEARAGTEQDESDASFVIRATRPYWMATMDGSLDPVYGLLRGRLKLAKGMLSQLLPDAEAARAMVRAARGIC